MTLSAMINASFQGDRKLPLRPADKVMDLERLGAMHQSRLSFMRTLVRRVMRERWNIEPVLMDLDDQGYGTVKYRINTTSDIFTFVLFSSYLSSDERNDRVIATKWDLTMALVAGDVDDEYFEILKQNVPKQEAGRLDSRVLVLSRANRSARNFDYVVGCLASGKNPDVSQITKVGYLYRTTAVYGSGKLGMADWEKVSTHYPDFDRPFSAEMFVCFMLKNFSLLQADHIARRRSPDTYKPMAVELKRYFGIGNATGLGMAPYLINHPLLVNQWIAMRELGLARVRTFGKVNSMIKEQCRQMLGRCLLNIEETVTEDPWQTANNKQLLKDIARTRDYIASDFSSWDDLLNWSEINCKVYGQELLVSIALELYPELVDELEDCLGVDETMMLNPVMQLHELQELIEKKYQWVFQIDFNDPDNIKTFWYRSEEKMEPRLGIRDKDNGDDKEMALGIGHAVYECYKALVNYIGHNMESSIAMFLMSHPELRSTVRRVQTMGDSYYGDIQANLLDRDVLPMHLLRAKLAFFGVSKCDPKSRLWVRNTMFQGAPVLEDIGKPFSDDWFMPVAPRQN